MNFLTNSLPRVNLNGALVEKDLADYFACEDTNTAAECEEREVSQVRPWQAGLKDMCGPLTAILRSLRS